MNINSDNQSVQNYIDAVAQAFIDHLTHRDASRLEQDIRGVFSNYPYVSEREKIEMEEAFSILVERALGSSEYLSRKLYDEEMYLSTNPLDKDEKLDVILRSVFCFNGLFNYANNALVHIAREVDKTGFRQLEMDARELNGFDVLKKYPDLKSGTQKYVWAVLNYLAHYNDEYYLPNILYKIEGTKFEEMFSDEHVGAYLAEIDSVGIDDDSVDGIYQFLKSRHVWKMVEKEKPAIFCAYTPVMHPSWTQGADESSKYYSFIYSEEHNLLLIDYSLGVDVDDIQNGNIDSRWVEHEDEDYLAYQYVLLAHAAEVLMGKRTGATTQDQAWEDHQKQWLLPVLLSDVQAIEQRMKILNIPIPTLPTAVIPSHGGSSQAYGSGSFNWAAHRAFRP